MKYVYWVRGEYHRRMCEVSAESVRKVDPDAQIHVYTDDPDLTLKGVKAIHIIPPGQPLMLANLEAQARAMYDTPKGEMVAFLDTDVLLLKKPAFAVQFNLAVTWRKHALYGDDGEPVVSVAPEMPYNYGVIFAEGGFPATEAMIWMRERVRKMGPQLQMWYGNQVALGALSGSPPGSFEMLDLRQIPWSPTDRGNGVWIFKLPCETWNYTPQKENENTTGKMVLHFKGKKRYLMESYARKMGLEWNVPPVSVAA